MLRTVSRHALGLGLAATALSLVTLQAMAQPTGNPKGTLAPAASESSKASEGGTSRSSAGSSGMNASGAARTNPDAPEARNGSLRTPGSGTAGGLSGRHPGKADGSSGARETNQAPKVQGK